MWRIRIVPLAGHPVSLPTITAPSLGEIEDPILDGLPVRFDNVHNAHQ
jgi:hypothetical protein